MRLFGTESLTVYNAFFLSAELKETRSWPVKSWMEIRECGQLGEPRWAKPCPLLRKIHPPSNSSTWWMWSSLKAGSLQMYLKISWGHPRLFGWVLYQKMSVLIRDRREGDSVKGHVKTELKIGGLWPQAKECLEPPEAGRGGGGGDFSPRDFRAGTSSWHRDFGLLASRTVREWISVNCSKPLCLWPFVTAAAGNSYRSQTEDKSHLFSHP